MSNPDREQLSTIERFERALVLLAYFISLSLTATFMCQCTRGLRRSLRN
jgi:hypothetical protein